MKRLIPSRALTTATTLGCGTRGYCFMPTTAHRQQISGGRVLGGEQTDKVLPHVRAMRELKEAADRELEKEAEVDEMGGVKSIPPLVPAGWRMHHEPLTRYVLLKKVSQVRPPKFAADADLLSPRQRAGKFNATPSTAITPPFRSSSEAKQSASCSPSGRFSTSSPIAQGMQVEIHIPFQTVDPSFYNNNIDICEWQSFDVFVSKPGSEASAILFRLAAVNSEMRVRHIQFLSPAAASAVDIMPMATGGEGNASPADLALRAFAGYGLKANYLRNMPYVGPSYSSLSSDLQMCIMDFLGADVGIDGILLEYILQTSYFAEHEEYQLWLAEMSRFAKMRAGTGDAMR